MTEKAAANTLARLGDVVSRCFLRRNALETATQEERNYAEVNQALAGGGKVFFISSFPRSGNTWVRFLLSDIFLQRAGRATNTVLPVHPDRVIPDIYCNLVSGVERGITPGLFVKTHEGFDRLKKRIPAAELRRCRHVYIIRSPEDSLISFYRYHLREENLKHKLRQGMDSFCRARVRDWVSNAGSYTRAAAEGAEVYFVSYEKLFEQTGPVLNGMLDWLGVEHQDVMVRRAVTNMQFDKMRREEERGKVNGNEFPARGGPGAGAAELKAETLAAIREAAAEVMTQVKWHLSRQKEVAVNGNAESKMQNEE